MKRELWLLREAKLLFRISWGGDSEEVKSGEGLVTWSMLEDILSYDEIVELSEEVYAAISGCDCRCYVRCLFQYVYVMRVKKKRRRKIRQRWAPRHLKCNRRRSFAFPPLPEMA